MACSYKPYSFECPAPAEPRAHVITPEIAAEANRHLATAHESRARARSLRRSIDDLEKMLEDAHRSDRESMRRAGDLLFGIRPTPPDGRG